MVEVMRARRVAAVRVYLAPEELEVLVGLARANGESLSGILRRLALAKARELE